MRAPERRSASIYIKGDARLRIILAPSSGRGRRAKRGGVGIPASENSASRANLRPFGAPPSIGRRECPREPLPLEGAAERSEAGLASFFAAKPPPLCLPLEEKAQRRGGWGTGGRKVREGMRIKQAIHGSTRAPVFVNDDARK